MDTTWIVTADNGRARIFSVDRTQRLQEVEGMVNTAARMRTAQTHTDRLGPTAAGQSMHNTGGGATPNKQYEPPQTPAEHEAELFAKHISACLLKGHQEGRFQKLALIAAPKFLGLLRAVLAPQLKPLVGLEIDKDYTHSNGQQLRAQIQVHQANG
jgi:protein required for attachment to host cells